jgi:hypothetical protein
MEEAVKSISNTICGVLASRDRAPDGWVEIQRDERDDEARVYPNDEEAALAVARAGGMPGHVALYSPGASVLVFDLDSATAEETIAHLESLDYVTAECPRWIVCVPESVARLAGV